MKFNANDYTPGETIKMIRQWTELTQEGFAASVNSTKGTIANYEQDHRSYTFATFLDFCKIHGITVTIEKKQK